MATLVLGTVGRALGGPLGGLVGTIVGSTLDRGIFGSGATREGPRVANLTVQSAAYGEPLPRLYGRMRVAGNLVWTAGIRESRTRSGGGKRGTATNTYSYSASFAVIVSGRAIVRIDRIWADGKLLRSADGVLSFPATIRTYPGDEAQSVDPLIAAAEGIGAAPAYRGRAYVVFEDLSLAEYGNRIPNLTFEVVADAAPVGVRAIARDVAADGFAIAGDDLPTLGGFAAARAGSVRQTLAQLADLADLAFSDGETGLMSNATGAAPTPIAAAVVGASDGTSRQPAWRESRAPDSAVPDEIVVGFSDPARDFQPGLQRAVRRAPALRSEQHDLPIAVAAADGKSLAEAMLRRAITRRTTARVTTSWRHAAIRPADTIRIGDAPELWRVRRTTLTGSTVEFDIERLAATPAAGSPGVDPGRAYLADDAPNGPTVLHVLELPSIAGAVATSPRLLLAAAGATTAWRRAEILLSRDGGASYAPVATVDGPASFGVATTVLQIGNTDRWDRVAKIEIDLANSAMALDDASEFAVLGGANIALVGDEIIQFAHAVSLGGTRYRLDTLLRGRRGTEAAVGGHRVGERFVLLDDRVTALDLPVDAIGLAVLLKAVGPGEDLVGVPGVGVTLAGSVLRPLSPVALTVVANTGGDRQIAWTRRSRAGFAWLDGADAPLGEDAERYRVTIAIDGVLAREVEVDAPSWTYAAASFAADGGASARTLTVGVAQLSAIVGAGAPATRVIDLS